jgi:CheY-like chemotaxis protein
MLVEDDNNLREIYGARLLAEGHEIVAAKDGEEALALAVKEKPDLIISDIMMPRISGFEMLDILRSAPETKNTKVIMMTALSQAEDKSRADKLGADRYLVKSQVTLEDVAKVVRDVLDDGNGSVAPDAGSLAPQTTAPTQAAPTEPPQAAPTPPVITTPTDAPINTTPVATVSSPAQTIPVFATPPSTTGIAVPPATDTPLAPIAVSPPAFSEPVVSPASPTVPQVVLPVPPDEAREANASATPAPQQPLDSTPVSSVIEPSLAQALAQEEKQVQDKIDSFANQTAMNAPEVITPPEPPTEADKAAAVSASASIEFNPSDIPSEFSADNTVNAPQLQEDQPAIEQPPVPPTANDEVTSPLEEAHNAAKKRIISPLNDPLAKPDLEALLAEEEKKEAVVNPAAATIITPAGKAANAENNPEPKPATGGNVDHNSIAL